MISPSQTEQLKRLNVPRALDVGAGTQIGKLTICIKRNRLPLRDISQAADLVALILPFKE